MYYKIKSATVKGGTLHITAAASNCFPITYFRTTFEGCESMTVEEQVRRFAADLYGHEFKFLPSSRCALKRVFDVVAKECGTFTDHCGTSIPDEETRRRIAAGRDAFVEAFWTLYERRA